jgi:hypothetical protein
MTRRRALFQVAPLLIVAGGALLSAQTTLLPSAPPRQFGASVAPVYEGWWDNPDGTRSALFGYYSRNTVQQVDVPLGANNHFEPGDPDRGQPTHFLASRQYGMFTVSLPKGFDRTQKLIWVLNTAGYSTSVPVNLAPDFNLTPNKSSEESPDHSYNLPPILKFGPADPSFTMPMAGLANLVKRTAIVNVPLALDIVTEDDARYASGANAPMKTPPPVVTLRVTKYRGPGPVTIANPAPAIAVTAGGRPFEPFAGRAATTVSFSEPGEYMIHVAANDYSGPGGGGSGCCWTTALMKVTVGTAGKTLTGGN